MGALSRLVAVAGIAMLLIAPRTAWARQALPTAGPAAAERAEPPKDRLGRTTPRGTVLGFLSAARSGDNATAAQYLNTTRPPDAAEDLARQLFIILDARLPARLTQISAEPEGSGSSPLGRTHEIVGTIASSGGDVSIVVERVEAGSSGQVWLFSRATLDAVPALYDEVSLIAVDTVLPRFLTQTRVAGLRLFDWLAVLLGLPTLYLLMVLLNRLLSPSIAFLWLRLSGRSGLTGRDLFPTPARLLLLAVAMHWIASSLLLPLLARQLWFNAAVLIAIAAGVWLGILLNGEIERLVRRRIGVAHMAAVSLLRVGRRFGDLLVIFIGILVLFRYYSVDPTPALAGLGVGGIAVALAAQKTLENVVGGMSLIFDGAVMEGDFLKVGDITGTVEHVGLRSIRIRTLDRTVVTLPNGQTATMSLETLSARDKFWFHPLVGLRYETTPEQLEKVVQGIRGLLAVRSDVEPDSVRVRFLRLGPYSLDVDVFAYVFARDWNHFLELQEQLLFAVMKIVRDAGAQIAFPSQTLYMSAPDENDRSARGRRP